MGGWVRASQTTVVTYRLSEQGFGTSMAPARVDDVVPKPLDKRIGGTGKSSVERLRLSPEVVLDDRHIQVMLDQRPPLSPNTTSRLKVCLRQAAVKLDHVAGQQRKWKEEFRFRLRRSFAKVLRSLSATSTADSLSSSFLCSAANEANSVIPPPYSCSLDELQATPGHPPSLSIPHSQPSLPSRSPSCEMPLSASLPRHNGSLHLNQSYVSGTAMSTTGSDVSSLAGVGTPGSPPRATSPTQEIRELLDKIQQLPLEETPHDLSGDCGVPTGFIVKSKWHRVEKSCGSSQHCNNLFVSGLDAPSANKWSRGHRRSLLTKLCLDQPMTSV
uniref:(California timema) hypothetical protein n=1 Tax=Timema californicum TaxID=61474 RepID=A0A7R9J552_TIMCA|nr:unnamed protein product [Timema californicum]